MKKIIITGLLVMLTSVYCLPQSYSLKLFHSRDEMLKLQLDRYSFYLDDAGNELKSDKAYRIYFKLNPPEGSSFNSKQVNIKVVDKKGNIAAERMYVGFSDKGLDSCIDVPRGSFEARVYDDNNRLIAKSDAIEVTYSPEKQSDFEEQKNVDVHTLIVTFNLKSGDSAYYPFVKNFYEIYLTISNSSPDKSTDDIYVYMDNGTDLQRVSLTNLKSFRKVEHITADGTLRNFEFLYPKAKGISVAAQKNGNSNDIMIVVRGE